MLLVLGVPERTVMSVMGWSSTSMAARYQHVTDPIRRDVARRMGTLLWSTSPDEERSVEAASPKSIETKTETTGPRTAVDDAGYFGVLPGQTWRRMGDSNPRER